MTLAVRLKGDSRVTGEVLTSNPGRMFFVPSGFNGVNEAYIPVKSLLPDTDSAIQALVLESADGRKFFAMHDVCQKKLGTNQIAEFGVRLLVLRFRFKEIQNQMENEQIKDPDWKSLFTKFIRNFDQFDALTPNLAFNGKWHSHSSKQTYGPGFYVSKTKRTLSGQAKTEKIFVRCKFQLGQGVYKVCRLLYDVRELKQYCRLKLKKEHYKDPNLLFYWNRELEINRRIMEHPISNPQYPGVLRAVEIFTIVKNGVIKSEIAVDIMPVDMLKFLNDNKNLKSNERKTLCCAVLRSVYIFHTVYKMASRDIKLENLMVNPKDLKDVRLADFSFARGIYEIIPGETSLTGSPRYAPPDGDIEHSMQWDDYSTGVCIYALLHNAFPETLPNRKPVDIMNEIALSLLSPRRKDRARVIDLFPKYFSGSVY